MPMNTPYLSTPSGSTTVLSDLSSRIESNSVSVGGGTPLVVISTITIPLVATTVVATKSTLTTYPFVGAKAAATADATGSDLYVVANHSGVSAGVVIDAYSSTSDVVTLRLSNVSVANAAQDPITLRVTRFGF